MYVEDAEDRDEYGGLGQEWPTPNGRKEGVEEERECIENISRLHLHGIGVRSEFLFGKYSFRILCHGKTAENPTDTRAMGFFFRRIII